MLKIKSIIITGNPKKGIHISQKKFMHQLARQNLKYRADSYIELDSSGQSKKSRIIRSLISLNNEILVAD